MLKKTIDLWLKKLIFCLEVFIHKCRVKLMIWQKT